MENGLIEKIEHQIISTPSLFSLDENFSDERFCKVRIAAMHSGINRNNSRFSTECIKNAKSTFSNIPILADIIEYEDENGNKVLDYSGHSMHIEEDAMDNSKDRIVYDEKVVGVIPETNNFEIIKDEETGNDYAYVDALLYRDYGNYCVDILESRGGKTDVSMEISCDDISYSSKDKCLDVGKMTACACTLLGDSVTPGMAKAHAEVFSSNSENISSQLIQIMQELKESLDNYTKAFNAEKSKEGGKTMTKFEELLEKYGKTVEEIEFEYENLSDEELEVAFANAFAESENSEGDNDEVPASDENSKNYQEDESSEGDESSENDEPKEDSVEFTVTHNGESKTFSVSLNDKLAAMYNLISETYSELDNEWYDINMYDEEKYVEMYGYFTGRNYRQSYKVKNDNYTLIGDRVEVYKKYMTQDEINTLESLKANYAELEQYKASKEAEEAHAERMSVLTDYSTIEATDEFKALVENIDSYSVEEISEKADAIVGKYARQGMQFSFEEKKSTAKKIGIINKEPKNPKSYAGLFD